MGSGASSVGGWQLYGLAFPSLAAEENKEQPANLEPITKGSSLYGTSDNFKVGDCSKSFFSNVDFKFLTGGSSTEAFDLNWTDTGDLRGCLILNAKHQGDKGPLAASTELAAVQGNKGLVMWTVIPGKPTRGDSIREEIRVVLLDKSEETWTAKKGFSWFTKAGSGKNGTNKGIKIKVTGTDTKTLDNTEGKFWEGASTDGTDYKGRWSFSSSTNGDGETLLSKLEITDKNNKVSGLWGTTDHKLTKGSFLYGSMGTDWKWSSNFSNSLSKDVDIPFKDIKGKWETVNVATA